MWQVIVYGFMLGLVSSFHCVGMCGPLAMALPVKHLPIRKRNFSIVLYHAGRLLTYILLGVIFGLLGRRIYLAGLQQWLSIISGIIILIFALQYLIVRPSKLPSFTSRFYNSLSGYMFKQLKIASFKSFFLLGLANGLLPCGMVYIAVAMALTTNSILNGTLLMGMFGFGTMPAMIAMSYASFLISIPARNKMKKAMPFIMMAIAILLILRGLNLGIPYVSPVLAPAPGKAIICH